MGSIDTTLEGAVGTVFEFIGNPHSLWANGDFEDKRLVLNLAFTQKIPFSKKDGFGTSGISLPFRVMSDIHTHKKQLVEGEGFEPSYAYAGGFTVLRSGNFLHFLEFL